MELLNLLSSCEPRNIGKLKTRDFSVKKIIPFYAALSKEEEAQIWAAQRVSVAAHISEVPEDERVEDAGLGEPVLLEGSRSRRMVGATQ
jgi:hypothetical protein